MSKEWLCWPGRRPSYCPFCGQEIEVTDDGPHGRPQVDHPRHVIWPRTRKIIAGVEYDFDRFTCEERDV